MENTIFKRVSRISISTAVFAVMTLLVGYLSTLTDDLFVKIEIQLIALIFLVLFFYSLLKDQLMSGKDE
jgi:hypothetical protein